MAKKKKQNNEETNEESQPTDVISTKKVIYTEIDDEVTSIYDKIKKVKAKHVYIVIPKRAVIFQSIVNLKILKRKAKEDRKIIYFITNDTNGVYLAQQIGIQVYNKANDEGKPALFSTDIDDDKLRITPLRASVNSIEEDTPTRLTERKLSISEILRKKKSKKALKVSKIGKPTKKKSMKQKFVVIAPNRHALIGLIVLSVFILLVIVYIALPGVTIYLTPSASVLEKSVNITLSDYQNNRVELETRPPHMIASFPIDATVTKTITHFATGKKFSEQGVNASGKITIINTSSNSWPLIDQTRFQTESGLVYRIKSPITVPAASSDGPGKIEAFVMADQTDANGMIVGERGNIGPSKFFLPGLRESSRSLIYAESYEAFTGGVTDYVAYISAEDIDAAKSRLEDELNDAVIEELEDIVEEQTNLVGGGTTYTLLTGEGAIKTGDIEINVDADLEGRVTSEFQITGSVSAEGVYYDHDAMLEILKSELLLKKSPQKELLSINEDTTSYRIFEWDEHTGKIKVTANIKGIEQFSIDPDKESGERLLNKIQEHIAGKDIEEAKVYIQNLPEINRVEIDSWPVWSPTIPKLTENIEFEIRDAKVVQ